MRSRHAVLLGSVSLAALIAATSAGWADTTPDTSQGIETVVVTARKRPELAQDTPVTLQAFSAQKIKDLNFQNFDDYARFAPSVSFNEEGPGQTTLVIRGITASSADRTLESPAALYLDEQPITAHGLMPDPHLLDIERIEVLPGPQGTLFGASSESGTIRVITNKPQLDTFEGSLEATGSSMEHGKLGYDVNGMVNIPIIDDTLALRVVAFNTTTSGFIDNVPGTTPGGTSNNFAIAKKDVNPKRESGLRSELKWQINSDVSVTASYMFQNTDQSGPSSFDPTVGDLKTVRFFDEFFKDKWEQYALTLNADIGFADVVASSGFFQRHINNVADDTAYMQYLTGLAAAYPKYDSFYNFGPDPKGYYDFHLKNQRFSNEVRLTSKPGSRWSWIVGGFYENDRTSTLSDSHITNYELTPSYASVAAYLPAPTDVYFHQAVTYDRSQISLFGELSYEITDQLTATIGGRYFKAHNNGHIYTEIPEGLPIENSHLKAPQNGETPKVELSYKWTPSVLVYALYSEGFRFGGANRQKPNLAVPVQYGPDHLYNYEIGTKTEWFDDRLQLNFDAYWMQWKNFQLSILNPDPATFYYVVANVGQAESKGVEAEFEARPVPEVTVGGSATYLDAELTDPSPAVNAPAGTRLPVTPRYKFAFYAEYDFPIEWIGAAGHLRGDVSRTGGSTNDIDPTQAMHLPPYTTANFQLGAETDVWGVNLFVNNAFDERAVLYLSPATYEHQETPDLPRTIGLTVSRKF